MIENIKKIKKNRKTLFSEKENNFKAKDDSIKKVKKIAEKLCLHEELELVDFQYHTESNGKVLRIYIDKVDGVNISDCIKLSKQLTDILNVNLGDNEKYSLEVSSPGENRPLVKEDDFQRFIGNNVLIKMKKSFYDLKENKKKYKGKLLGICNGFVNLEDYSKTINLPFEAINKACLFKQTE